MRSKDVRSVDLFMMGQFINVFRGVAYQELSTLAQCYELYCAGELSQSVRRNETESTNALAQVAETAFEILISKKKRFTDIKEQHIARLISSHSSVTNYLVATHVMNLMSHDHSSKSARSVSASLSYVFPAEVNGYTKQMMRSDRKLESKVISFIKRRSKGFSTLARSHAAYLIGRVNKDHASEMMPILQDFKKLVRVNENQIDRDNRMLRRTIVISRSQLGDHSADLDTRYITDKH